MLDPAGKLILPMAFIPAAERYNLMPAIDRWVVGTMFAHIANDRATRPAQPDDPVYAINLSGVSLADDGFADFIQQQLATYPIPPASICFEITETAAISNLAQCARLMRKLTDLGFSFALDDFGSGMSSFAYLKQLPVDFLKIDGSFVRDIVDDPIDFAMVEAINHIGHLMGLRTIAEFVENDAIAQKLRGIGVDFAQGYGLAKPAPFIDAGCAAPARLSDA
jgi:EAL domain-containing protein (putative c-di-GMP-specific phosphodiesterase class I)